MANREVLGKDQREKLFSRLREEPEFRELMKKDWRAALKDTGVNPATVVKGTLTRQEIESFARQRAGWEIIIIIFARGLDHERVELKEAVNFAARK